MDDLVDKALAADRAVLDDVPRDVTEALQRLAPAEDWIVLPCLGVLHRPAFRRYLRMLAGHDDQVRLPLDHRRGHVLAGRHLTHRHVRPSRQHGPDLLADPLCVAGDEDLRHGQRVIGRGPG